MKNLLGLILLFVFISCSDVEPEKEELILNVTDFNHTDCLKSISISDNSESFFIRSNGEGKYQIEHLGVVFNCCLPEGIEMDLYLRNDTIFYTDKEQVMGICDCICSYNTSLEFDGIDNGEYIVCFSTGNENLGSKTITFNEELDMVIAISDLDQN